MLVKQVAKELFEKMKETRLSNGPEKKSPEEMLKRFQAIYDIHKGHCVVNDTKFLWVEKAIAELRRKNLVSAKFKGTQKAYFNLLATIRCELQKIIKAEAIAA